MRIVVKGGVWRNTEDEILKAAISKYGKNQWARISSLLVRKTPKQCKARWYEWLDPSIKKTEWSKEEDEKLLHLAKLMPTQWRTIASLVGRTANQCLERYQQLLDDAEAKDNEELGLTGASAESRPTAEDVRRLRPGEIDPVPESRPARPDPVDLDEDEKEMLSEARARLANTQGKKAKRKARERQLDEARRLAALQKRREMRAAGIQTRYKNKKRGMDYMADIPFEKQPAPGFYDVSDENARMEKTRAPVGKTIRQMDGKRKMDDDQEAERRKKQKKAQEAKNAESHFQPEKDLQIQRLKEAEQISKRRKLVLPEPQVGEAELDEIVKLGQAGESARELVDDGANEAGQGLLGDYSALQNVQNARTPRTAPQTDRIMTEARNLRNRSMAQTPLLGQEVEFDDTSARETRDGNETPRNIVTPNPLATPRSGSGNDRQGLMDAKERLRKGFSSLPAPENNFEIVDPDEMETDEPKGEEDISEEIRKEDAAERDARLARERKLEEERRLARRSSAVKRNLPRPMEVNGNNLRKGLRERRTSVEDEVDRLVTLEMIEILEYDSVAYPVAGGSKAGSERARELEVIGDEAIANARKMVEGELGEAVGFPGASQEQLGRLIGSQVDMTVFDEVWMQQTRELMYDEESKSFMEGRNMSLHAKVAGVAAQISAARQRYSKENGRVSKLEKRLNKMMGGYEAVAKSTAEKLRSANENWWDSYRDLESLRALAITEQVACVTRKETLEEEVERLERKELNGQSRYKELNEEREQLKAFIASAEEELIMREAEKLNEAALEE